jgi:hypothetical protein
MLPLSKKISLLAAILSFTFTSFGQFSIGVKGGGNMSSWKVTTNTPLVAAGQVFNLGYQYGYVFNFGLNDYVSIQPELLFIQKGVKQQIIEDSFYGDGEFKFIRDLNLNYLELPLLAKLKLSDANGSTFFLTIGPSFGYALNGKTLTEWTEYEETETNRSESDSKQNFNQYSRFDMSASFGAGVSFPIGNGDLYLEVRYLMGLSNILKEENEVKYSNKGLGVIAGFMIPLKI